MKNERIIQMASGRLMAVYRTTRIVRVPIRFQRSAYT